MKILPSTTDDSVSFSRVAKATFAAYLSRRRQMHIHFKLVDRTHLLQHLMMEQVKIMSGLSI